MLLQARNPLDPWTSLEMRYLIRAFSLVLICLQPLFGQGAGELIPAGLAGRTGTWHLPEGAIVRLGKGSAGGGHAIDFSSDGRYLAVGSSMGVWIYEVAENRYVTLLPIGSGPTSVSFSPDGGDARHRIVQSQHRAMECQYRQTHRYPPPGPGLLSHYGLFARWSHPGRRVE